jgi:hypothetical protein
MPVKENQPHLVEALRQWFDDPLPLRSLDFDCLADQQAGSLEIRTLTAGTDLNDYLDPQVGQAVFRAR